MNIFFYWVERSNDGGERDVFGLFAEDDEKALQLVEKYRPIANFPRYTETKIINKIFPAANVFCSEFVMHDGYYDYAIR